MKRVFTDGMTVLFEGDSTTDCGRNRKKRCKKIEVFGDGYPRKVKLIYDALFDGNDVHFVNRAVSGDRIRNLIARYDEDVKAVKPDFISIMIGINDTWRAFDEANDYETPERFEKEYEEYLTKIKTDFPNIKIMIIEQFAFTCHPERKTWQEDLDGKRAVTRKLAEKYADYFIPMYDIMTSALDKGHTLEELSKDGVHPADGGHALLTQEYLKAVGIIE